MSYVNIQTFYTRIEERGLPATDPYDNVDEGSLLNRFKMRDSERVDDEGEVEVEVATFDVKG